MNRLLLVLSALLVCASAPPSRTPNSRSFTRTGCRSTRRFAGAERLQYVNAFYRDQWQGLDRDPKTALFQYSGKPGFIPGGIGLSFFQDELGQETNTVVKLAYAYHMEPDANGGILSLASRQLSRQDPRQRVDLHR